MIRPIFLYGEELLRKKASPLPPSYDNLEGLVDDMFETMYAASGLGLAAPQIGLSLQLFIASGRLSDEPSLKNYEGVFINPSILSTSEERNEIEEGCLSIPGIRAVVNRPSSLVLTYEDLQRQSHQLRIEGLLARIVQHEYDHLQGVLFIDYLSSLKRQLLRKKLTEAGNLPNVPYTVQMKRS